MAISRSHFDVNSQSLNHCSHTTQNHIKIHTLHTTGVPLLKNYIPVKINDANAHCMVDSGADISIANSNVLVKYGLKDICKIHPTDKSHITTASNDQMTIHGKIYVKIFVQNKCCISEFYLLDDLPTDFILGMD